MSKLRGHGATLTLMSAPLELLERYRRGFVSGDVGALVACFTFPLQVVSVGAAEAPITIVQADQWPGVLQGLLGAYRRLGVTDCVRVAVQVTQPMEAVAIVGVQWELRRGAGEPVYDFTAVYTLVLTQGCLQIAAIAHDELPKMQAALQAI